METEPESLAVQAVLARGAATLGQAGIPEPRREAGRIWAGLCGQPDATAWLASSAPLDRGLASRFGDAVRRRASGKPLAYVIGSWGFRHLTLIIDDNVLIPRPETEGLVDLVLERASGGRVADIGTGSGCVALALATEGSFDMVLGVDRSAAALAVAGRNAAAAGVALPLVLAHFGSALSAAAFDVIVSNPPYLSEAEYQGLDLAVKAFEPRLALESGPDGLTATRAVLTDAVRALRPGGWVALEIDSTRADASARLAAGLGLGAVTIHQDLFGRERFLLAQRSVA